MRKLTVILFLAIPFIPTKQLHSQNTKVKPAITDKYVLVDGYKMHYQTAGSGSPTVVFESGHYSTLRDWSGIFPAIAKMTRVVSHDRLGMGSSEESSKTRTYKQIALELHMMLQQAKIQPPYILVGHSMGGAVVRAFASQYRNETVGLVLVDPLNEYVLKGMPEAERKKVFAQMDSVYKDAPSTVYKEFIMMDDDLKAGSPQLNSFDLPDIPTVLLVAGKDRPGDWTSSLIDLYKEKFNKLSDSRLVVLNQSPHYIQSYDAPTVIEAIRRIIYPDAEVILNKTLSEKGVDSTIMLYKKMRSKYPPDLLPERVLNMLGYQILNKDAAAAIRLFALNAELYPASSNVYDSLGESYMVAGDKSQAIKNYEKSLTLDPGNNNAKKMLDKLRTAK
jgi:pimeloyl-ACP methyl ester carboxylesterase